MIDCSWCFEFSNETEYFLQQVDKDHPKNDVRKCEFWTATEAIIFSLSHLNASLSSCSRYWTIFLCISCYLCCEWFGWCHSYFKSLEWVILYYNRFFSSSMLWQQYCAPSNWRLCSIMSFWPVFLVIDWFIIFIVRPAIVTATFKCRRVFWIIGHHSASMKAWNAKQTA